MPRPLCLPLSLCFVLVPGFAWTAERVSFNRDIRPVLSDTCFHCHGFDEKERKSGLRLDLREEALKPAKSGAIAIVPGKSGESELMARLLSHDEDEIMPPTKLHKPLTALQKETFRQWIDEGAEYQGHWAFLPLVKPEIPALKDAPTAIDAFIQERLAQDKLPPSPAADKATLIRRVTLDLIGLPPLPQEVDAFVNDPAPDAYEKVVDRLLASAAYGEQMARQWLDFARYADSHGFQTDSSRNQWPWRDWVIRAFNENMPFDQFTVEQIAGDLLPDATRDQIVATGFNRNHRLNGEGGIIDEEWRIENNIDRVETTTFTWLGLTMNCARCHDHKYDPVTQKDFYSFFAFFNNLPESGTIVGPSNRAGGNSVPVLDLPTPEQEQIIAKLEGEIKNHEKRAGELEKNLPQMAADWEADLHEHHHVLPPVWSPVEVTVAKSEGGAVLTRQGDGSWLATGKNPDYDEYELTVKPGAGPLSGLRLETLTDEKLPKKSPGRAPEGNFVLTAFEVFLGDGNDSERVPLKLARAEASYSQKGYEIENIVQGKGGWAVDGAIRHESAQAMFVLAEAPVLTADSVLTVKMKHDSAFHQHNIGRFRLTRASAPAAELRLQGNDALAKARAILDKAADKRNAKEQKELQKIFRETVDSPLRQTDEKLATARKGLDDLKKTMATVMVMKEGPVRDAFILKRGLYDQKGDKVTAGTPAVLPPMPLDAPRNRLGLARWLVDSSNPLTARVWVNRAWEKFFGVGLCKTSENLGSQSEWPSHPELLDWLAAEFMAQKWDMKAFQKMLVMSAAYRQSSRVTPGLLERDPENRLLARGPRFRLTGEAIRDQALAIGGLLVPKVGGPSVRPYMPEGVWDETSMYGDLRGYKADEGEGLYRRSLYTMWKRTAAPPTMLLFDAPSREICAVTRSRTNTPLQALILLNEVTFVEAARGLAQEMMRHNGDGSPEERLKYGFKRATAREVDVETLATLVKGWRERRAWFQTHAEDARKLIHEGSSTPDAKLDPVELAAFTTSATVLLNLDRVVTRD